MISPVVAADNIQFFISLSAKGPVTNLYVDPDSKVSFDQRVLKSIRRYCDGSSRNDLITPIQESFASVMGPSGGVAFSTDDLTLAVDNIANYLKELYTEEHYTTLFKTLIRQVRLGILDKKTYSKVVATYSDVDIYIPVPAPETPVAVINPQEVPRELPLPVQEVPKKCPRRRRH